MVKHLLVLEIVLRIKNKKFSGCYFYINTKIQGDFHICISVSLSVFLVRIFPRCTKKKFSIKDFFSKCYQISKKVWIWSHLLKKSLMEKIFCEVPYNYELNTEICKVNLRSRPVKTPTQGSLNTVQVKEFNDTINPGTAQKMKFCIKDFFIKCDKICCFLRIWSYLLKKSLMENVFFCAVWSNVNLRFNVKYRVLLNKIIFPFFYSKLQPKNFGFINFQGALK